MKYKEVYLAQGWEMVMATSFAERDWDMEERDGIMYVHHRNLPDRFYAFGHGQWAGKPAENPQTVPKRKR